MDRPAAQMLEQILEQGICISGQLYQFERRALFDNKLSIVLPKNFIWMEESFARIKYPMESRPQVIYTNTSGNVNFAFSHLDNQIDTDQVKDCCAHFKAVIAKVNPAYIFGESADETMDRVQLSWFEFVGFAIDMDIYNFMYIANVEGKILHGMFNCPAEAAEDWKIVIRQVVRTMKDLTIREQAAANRSRRLRILFMRKMVEISEDNEARLLKMIGRIDTKNCLLCAHRMYDVLNEPTYVKKMGASPL